MARTGPIPVAEFMSAALADPEHGYYMGRDPFGTGGDFTTAPEVSQMFGELIGLWCALVWQSMGSPERIILAEIGPGRGTLMLDLLRAAAALPPFADSLDVHLIETSPALRNRQAQTLAGKPVTWHERFEDLPDGPLLLVANELFDALPIRQLEKIAGQWHERMVGLDDKGDFAFVTGPVVAGPPLAPAALAAEDGALAELCPQGRELAARIARRLADQGGAALIIDYGYGKSASGDTLQALKGHRYHPVLSAPGTADLTAHVDFQALAEAALGPAKVHGPVSQGRFLMRLGLEERALMLMKGATHDQAAELARGARRLIDPGEMGTLFQVMAFSHPLLPTPPGLEP
ncbi:MAG: SAM-dependent methyltransferase [Magnetospirillum sp.]|nr:SAM-dependent methyltransferase [Magnetospirillum sp.]